MWRSAARGFLPKLADISCRKPWAVIALPVLLVSASLIFSIERFHLTADSVALITAKVPWRLNERRIEEALPGNTDAIMIVIDGAAHELAEQTA